MINFPAVLTIWKVWADYFCDLFVTFLYASLKFGQFKEMERFFCHGSKPLLTKYFKLKLSWIYQIFSMV